MCLIDAGAGQAELTCKTQRTRAHSLVVENAHLRQAINGYSEEFLEIAAAKHEMRQRASWPQAQKPTGLARRDGEALRQSLREQERREREEEDRWLAGLLAKRALYSAVFY